MYAEGERAEVRGHLKTDGQTDAFKARVLRPLYSLVQTSLFAPFPGLNRMNVRSFARDENTSRGFQCIQKVRFSCQRSPMVNSSLSRAEALSLALSACVFARVCIYITRRLLFAVLRTLRLRKHSHARRSAMGDVSEDNLVK